MDSVFRFVQAGAEVSRLLGRLPSRGGHQPRLATEVAGLQERIASVAGSAVRGDDPGTLAAEVLARFQSDAEEERGEHVEMMRL